jgi:hypothetical protein
MTSNEYKIWAPALKIYVLALVYGLLHEDEGY